jgi:cell wall-associated NlpC family hydrolase
MMSDEGKRDLVKFQEAAARCVGRPYVHRGRGPEGFDCFGLLLHLAAAQGCAIPDYDYPDAPDKEYGRFLEEYWKFADAVDERELMAGDVVMFLDQARRAVTHVGLYLGFGKFVHCGLGGVQIGRLDQRPFKGRLAFCCRLKGSCRPDGTPQTLATANPTLERVG